MFKEWFNSPFKTWVTLLGLVAGWYAAELLLKPRPSIVNCAPVCGNVRSLYYDQTCYCAKE